MMKLSRILVLFLIGISHAKANEISDECLQSMQKVYKFYYYEILPKADESSDQFPPDKTNEMQIVIGNLKSSCSPEVVAKMNQLLQADEKNS